MTAEKSPYRSIETASWQCYQCSRAPLSWSWPFSSPPWLMGTGLSSLMTCWFSPPLPLHRLAPLFVSLCGQLKSSHSGDRVPAGASDWTSPSLLAGPRCEKRARPSPLIFADFPCPINHFLSERRLFDQGNLEIPLYLPLISKPSLLINIKWWFWDDLRVGWATWWAEHSLIYYLYVCWVCYSNIYPTAQHHHTEVKTSCALKISCHFIQFSGNSTIYPPICGAMLL